MIIILQSYIITYEGLIPTYHSKYYKSIGLSTRSEAYIQSTELKKILKSISFERGLSIDDNKPWVDLK